LLKNPLQKDNDKFLWNRFDTESGEGQIVVNGDFNSGPYLHWKHDPVHLTDKVTLICDELYPEIFEHFHNLNGIICEGGALTSHLSILARECGMPLWIQVSNASTRFPPIKENQ
jgi:phosphohistidine swiveling domain-containing protein